MVGCVDLFFFRKVAIDCVLYFACEALQKSAVGKHTVATSGYTSSDF